MKARDTAEIVRRFDELPDDMLVRPPVAAIVLGLSESRLREAPPIPVKKPNRNKRYRVGDIRALVRGTQPAA